MADFITAVLNFYKLLELFFFFHSTDYSPSHYEIIHKERNLKHEKFDNKIFVTLLFNFSWIRNEKERKEFVRCENISPRKLQIKLTSTFNCLRFAFYFLSIHYQEWKKFKNSSILHSLLLFLLNVIKKPASLYSHTMPSYDDVKKAKKEIKK